MGAFCLVCTPDPVRRERLLGRLAASLSEQGFADPARLDAASFSLLLYGKLGGEPPQLARAADGRFAALAGTALLRGSVGQAAARALLDARTGLTEASGCYCAIRGDHEGVELRTDPLGVYKVYTDAGGTVFSSSFLALAKALDGLTANVQGVYEYAHQEATYGDDTVVREIRLARSAGRYTIAGDVRFVPDTAIWRPRVEERPVSEHLEECLGRLREMYRDIATAFGDAVDTALSGGYDSRLTLALLREQGIEPAVHVYGDAGSPDVRVAQAIAREEAFELRHVDKSRYPRPSPEVFPEVVRLNHLAFDGWPSPGIFDGGADLATRRDRGAGGRLMLNGGGGEIFRNFFYLPDRSFSARELVWSFYNRYAPRWCTERFDERDYVAALAGKIGDAIGAQAPRLRREEVEYAYPVFRCGFWMGRNSSINNRLGWALTPFIDEALVRRAAAVPLRFKQHGSFEAALIRRVSPALARHPSDYGHAFDRDPPLARILKDYATLLRPPWLRRLSYRVQHRRPVPRPVLLRPEWLGTVIDPALPRLQPFFHVERVADPALFARLATLEYLFADLGVAVE